MKSLVEAVSEERERAYYERSLQLLRAGQKEPHRHRPPQGHRTGPKSSIGAAILREMVELRWQGWNIYRIAERFGYGKSTVARLFAKRLEREVMEYRTAAADARRVRGALRVGAVQRLQNGANGDF